MEKDQRDDGVTLSGGRQSRRTGPPPLKAGRNHRVTGFPRHDGASHIHEPYRRLVCREKIRLYYKAPARENTPVCVLTAEIRENNANGPLLCDLLSFKAFNLKSMENFCLRRYNLMRTGGSFRQWKEDFLSGDTGVENLAGLLMEKFMAEGFEESLVREELDRLDLRVRYEKGHAAITLRNPA